ncbi:amino acid ABC transporter membrane protein 2, PAAT family [Rhodoblastus acidophilus]|uniref:Amino acid ABC transporter membrane protein 2, PAAT family n=1 Tax=Rhodoblastus acidophilus TaxID=1074 RepID=A0A212RUB8_RHOAC|nr:amino acid ABC transporter permease [Rhodoblastus acidophilus]PPQ37346.1 amino acid ABC transporter permease [Rhodoblastus acidophilus]RAI23133.1 amino acid ABC transporter permease [Rhodoblastus acidophilus]SNB76230.1 amino acid ABC transporter membrane protein 2, PAAT family [Rhodoblastus acidophilus]
MTDFLRSDFLPALPPPPSREQSWREKLFGDARAAAITLSLLVGAALLLPSVVRYLFIDAVWRAPDGALCRAPGAGACWAYVAAKAPFFFYGAYPYPWRVNLTFALAGVLIVWLLHPRGRAKGYALAGFFLGLPVAGFVLLYGAPALGLPVVGTNLWGGALVSLIMALAGIAAALPGGVLLALGRRSDLPALRWLCVGIIEFVRGAPLIAVLFMANVLLPLFLPPDWAPDRLLRPLFGIALFASAYMAEVVRGGLAAVPRGQDEAAQALGLSRVKTLRLIVLPQALGAVIPGIVNNFVALFKDTTLVAIVGLFDFLHAIEIARLDPVWAGPQIALTGYIFAAAFYLGFCLAMSAYARRLEKKLAAARR